MQQEQIDAITEGDYDKVKSFDNVTLSLIDLNLFGACVLNYFYVLEGYENNPDSGYKSTMAKEWLRNYLLTIRFLSFHLIFAKQVNFLQNGVRCTAQLIFDYFWNEDEILKNEHDAIKILSTQEKRIDVIY